MSQSVNTRGVVVSIRTACAAGNDEGHVLIAPKDPSWQALSGFGIIAQRRKPWTNLLVQLVVHATEGMARQIL